jgi:hypothetical protein
MQSTINNNYNEWFVLLVLFSAKDFSYVQCSACSWPSDERCTYKMSFTTVVAAVARLANNATGLG